MILVLIAPTVVLKYLCSNSTDTSDIYITVTDRTNLSTDGTENTDRGIDDIGGISSMSTYAL